MSNSQQTNHLPPPPPPAVQDQRRSSNVYNQSSKQTKPIRIRKRDGVLQEVSFDKILWRLRTLSDGLDVDYTRIAQDGIAGLVDKMKSSDIDRLTANLAHQRHSEHPDYDILASRIIISNHHKETIGYELFSQAVWELYQSGQINNEFYETVQEYAAELDDAIDYDRDYYLTYFGFKTFERTYGMRVNGKVIERPQHMFMRVAVAIWMEDIERVIETYEWLSSKYFTHASPTNFNAGTTVQQLSSCFLVAMKDDSIKGIFETLGQCADISKTGGGLGLHCSNIRSAGEIIKSCGRPGVGLIPMLKGFEWMTNYVDQGRRRPGACAVYLEMHHPDIFDFLELKKNTGPDERRTRDLHLAMWISDLFMKRVKENGMWSLMPVVDCPGLQDAYGDEYEKLYTKYEREGRFSKQVRAQELYSAMIISQLETGEPYVLFKDHVNRKSNQMNIGTIKSSNLCAEITLVSNERESSVCNLLSIALPSYIRYDENEKPYFDFEVLQHVVKIGTRNLNKLIDRNFYPTPETKTSNMNNRPIGIGIQGLADTYIRMRYPYDSPEAAKLNKEIFEAMYYAALSESCELAQQEGAYSTFKGSPLSKGKFQFDLWRENGHTVELSGMWDWEGLRKKIKEHGVRNSMLLAVMPTASTSQFLGFNESFEAYTSNMYNRRTSSGDFKVINKQMVYDLIKLGLWNDKMRQKILYYDGSIQKIKEIPQHIRDIYKTSWDLKQRVIIDQSADRGPFICQTQSLNIHIEQPTIKMMSSLHQYAWEKGLKTGMYYLRRKPAKRAIQSTIDFDIEKEIQEQELQDKKDLENTNNSSTHLTKLKPNVDLKESVGEPVEPASPPTSDMEKEGWVCYKEEGCLSCGS